MCMDAKVFQGHVCAQLWELVHFFKVSDPKQMLLLYTLWSSMTCSKGASVIAVPVLIMYGVHVSTCKWCCYVNYCSLDGTHSRVLTRKKMLREVVWTSHQCLSVGSTVDKCHCTGGNLFVCHYFIGGADTVVKMVLAPPSSLCTWV